MSSPLRAIPATFRSIWTWIRGRPEPEGGFNSFAADVPIRRSADDLLGRVEFARALAKVLPGCSVARRLGRGKDVDQEYGG